MISMPAGIQTQLGEAVSVIADSDFWERWDTLVDVSDSYSGMLPAMHVDWTDWMFSFFLNLGPGFQTFTL